MHFSCKLWGIFDVSNLLSLCLQVDCTGWEMLASGRWSHVNHVGSFMKVDSKAKVNNLVGLQSF
jgi:hypothetical protein